MDREQRKEICLEAWTGPEVYLRFPDNRHINVVVSPMHRLPLPLKEIFLVLIFLEANPTAGAMVRPKGESKPQHSAL